MNNNYIFIIFVIVLCNLNFLKQSVAIKSILQSCECEVLEYDSLLMKDVYRSVEKYPYFPDGIEAMQNYIKLHFSPPVQREVVGSVRVTYVVDTDGDLRRINIYGKKNENITPFEKAFIDMLDSMPKWEPARCKGESVAFYSGFIQYW